MKPYLLSVCAFLSKPLAGFAHLRQLTAERPGLVALLAALWGSPFLLGSLLSGDVVMLLAGSASVLIALMLFASRVALAPADEDAERWVMVNGVPHATLSAGDLHRLERSTLLDAELHLQQIKALVWRFVSLLSTFLVKAGGLLAIGLVLAVAEAPAYMAQIFDAVMRAGPHERIGGVLTVLWLCFFLFLSVRIVFASAPGASLYAVFAEARLSAIRRVLDLDPAANVEIRLTPPRNVRAGAMP